MNRTLNLLTLLAMATTVGLHAEAEEPASDQPSTPAANVELMSDEALADAISSRLNEGLQAVRGDSDAASLLSVIKQLRPYGYGIVEEQPSGDASTSPRGGRGQASRAQGPSGLPTNDAEMKTRFSSMDQDGDGVWTGDEINSYMSSHESSSDGTVTFDEYKQAVAQLRGGGGQHAGRGGQGSGRGQGRGAGGMRGGRGGSGGGGSHRHGGGGHNHGGQRGRPTAAARASTDAKFVTSWDTDRDRQITADEVRQAVAANIQAQFSPEVGADSTAPMSDRGKKRRQERMIARASAIRALFILGQGETPAETVNASIMLNHLADPAEAASLWSAVAGSDESIPTKSFYKALTRVPADQLSLLK